MVTPVVDYRESSRLLLAQAYTELEIGDLRQASEKAWGAAAQIVKAAAQARGWEHDSHRRLFLAVNNLSEETGDTEIHRLFASPNYLHQNFYENGVGSNVVADHISLTEQFIVRIETILDAWSLSP